MDRLKELAARYLAGELSYEEAQILMIDYISQLSEGWFTDLAQKLTNPPGS